MSGKGTIVTETDVHWIVKVLREAPTLVRDAERFCGALGIHGTDLQMFRMSSRGPQELFPWALRTWILEAGDNATHESLVIILKGENFNRVAQRLADESRRLGRTQTDNSLETHCIWFEVPGPFLDFAGRASYLEKLHKSIIEQTKDYITIITTKTTTLVSGLGGIGKTTLAMHYAWTFQKIGFYSNVIWVNSETFTEMKDSLSRLAVHLKLNTSGNNPQDIEAIKLMELIYERFKGQQNTLFIFDNVENYEAIKQYLPLMKPNVRTPFVLLTSRNRIMNDKVDRIELDVFEENDSIEFFTKYLTLTTDVEKGYAKEISTMLHYLPLAIRQAGAYIRTQKENLKTSNENEMQKYISQFEENSKKLLTTEYWKRTNDIYEQTTFTTWNVTMDKIQEQSPMSVDLMKIMSYLTPDNISVFFLAYIDNQYFPVHLRRPQNSRFLVLNKRKLNLRIEMIEDAIAVLSDYSMITRQKTTLSIHRLVQHVIREQQTDESYLDECVELVKVHMPTQNEQNDVSSSVLQGTYIAVASNIKKARMEDKYGDFIKTVDDKLNSALTEQVQRAKDLITDGKFDEASKFIQKYRQRYSKSSSNRKLYLKMSIKLLWELSYLRSVSINPTECKIIADEIITSLNDLSDGVVRISGSGTVRKIVWVYFSKLSKRVRRNDAECVHGVYEYRNRTEG